MPRYFFHVRGSDDFIDDEEGTVVATADQARTYAARIARDLSLESGFEMQSVVVIDEHGVEIGVIPIATRVSAPH
jgi:hypothetical protein